MLKEIFEMKSELESHRYNLVLLIILLFKKKENLLGCHTVQNKI